MKYNSIPEYFYKLHNRLYAIMLLPLLLLSMVYWQMRMGNVSGVFRHDDPLTNLLLVTLGCIVITDWVASIFMFSRGMRATRTLDSLGSKLDRYALFTFLRFALVSSGSLGLGLGFYLTEHPVFTILTIANFLLLLFFWPSSYRVCRDLHLKGDEETLVLYKKDRL